MATPVRRADPFPKSVLLGAGAIAATALLAVGGARLSGWRPADVPTGVAPVASAALAFEDRADGAVLVRRADDGAAVAELRPGEGNFVRGVLRGFARERRLEHLGAGAALELTRWADGRLSLRDPVTGREVQLDSFGPTNSAAFAALLAAASTND